MSSKMYFENINDTIKNTLLTARKTANIAVAWINFKEYSGVFNALLNNGVKLKIICDNNQENLAYKPVIDQLINSGAEITLISMPTSQNKMHHKFAIIDESILINGSYNWSKNAESNIENVAITKDEPYIINQVIDEFEKISLLNANIISNLMKKQCCDMEHCCGEVVNLLVFSPNNSDQYYDAYGDIVSVCNDCGSYETIKHCLQDSSLWILCMGYESIDSDSTEEENLRIDREINSHLNKYMTAGVTIHGIGVVTHDYNKYAGDDIYTKIIWKNRFQSNRIFDRYEDTFGVDYE